MYGISEGIEQHVSNWLPKCQICCLPSPNLNPQNPVCDLASVCMLQQLTMITNLLTMHCMQALSSSHSYCWTEGHITVFSSQQPIPKSWLSLILVGLFRIQAQHQMSSHNLEIHLCKCIVCAGAGCQKKEPCGDVLCLSPPPPGLCLYVPHGPDNPAVVATESI